MADTENADGRQDQSDSGIRSLNGELLVLIAEQAQRVAPYVCISAAVWALMLLPYLHPSIPLVWLVLVFVLTRVHTRVLAGLPQPDQRSEDFKLTIAAVSFGLHGLLQIALICVFPFVPVHIGVLLTIYNIGLCSATVAATAGYSRIYTPYAIITLGPVALVWSLSPNLQIVLYERLLLAGLTLVYLISMLGHAKGTFVAFTGSYKNRVEVVKLNQRLIAALQDAESANQAKTQFLASASHDLRQPIHALSLFSGTLLLRKLDERTESIARQIDRAIAGLASQLDALLDISRLDAGVVAKSIAVVQLHESLQLLVQEFLPQANAKLLKLTLSCSAEAYVQTDPALLQRILRNLISNAIKYTDQGSIEISATQRGQHWRVEVQDTGIGIPLSEQKRVFDEFYQFNNPERDRSKGLGLGLAIVKRLSRLLDIQVELKSEPGRGSCFCLDIACATQEDLILESPAVEFPVHSKDIRVLVVDDEDIIRDVMKTLLEEHGFEVITCESTEAAVDICRRYRPSIVLADFRLAGADNGLKTIASLRAIWPDLPALLISGDTEPARLREAHDAGIELLHKPLASADLMRHIMRVLEP